MSGVPPPKIAVPQPKFLTPTLGDDILDFGHLIFEEIILKMSTKGKILWLKCTKFYFEDRGRKEEKGKEEEGMEGERK